MPRLPLIALTAAALAGLLTGCGSSKSSAPKIAAGTTPTTSAGPATTGTTQPPVAKPLTNAKGRYTVTVVVGTASTSPFPCSQPVGPGRLNVPYTITIKNVGTSGTTEPALGIILNDPQKAQGELAAVKLPQGPCVDFTLENNPLAAGQATTYQGSASNVSRAAELDVSLKVAPEGDPANDFIKVKLFP